MPGSRRAAILEPVNVVNSPRPPRLEAARGLLIRKDSLNDSGHGSDLLPFQFSRQKAEYVIGIARLVTAGTLDLEALRHAAATRAARTLRAVRGLGPWSVNYVMMRALGFPDCVPYGDTGLTSGLQSLLNLDERPGPDATRRHMAAFVPWRSLATAHLWQYNRNLLTAEPVEPA